MSEAIHAIILVDSAREGQFYLTEQKKKLYDPG